jgi:hypothetical protein
LTWHGKNVKGTHIMKDDLTPGEMNYLRSLSTIEPVKPELPGEVAARFTELGLAIALVEGGLQLTELGRERLEQAKARTAAVCRL